MAPALLLACSCLQEPVPAPVYPSFTAGRRVFTSAPSGNCAFTSDGRYAVVGDGAVLLFMELVHGRVHGSVPLAGAILFVEPMEGSDGVFAVTQDSVYVVTPGSFTVSVRAPIPAGATSIAASGGRLFIGFSDGSLRGFNPETLVEELSGTPFETAVLLAGTPECIVAASGTSVAAFDPFDLDRISRYDCWGDVVHIGPVGDDGMCASVLGGNEVALFSLPGLELAHMFTVPGTPLAAAVSGDGAYAFAHTDQGTLVAVGQGGGVDWRTDEFGVLCDLAISGDGWNALVLSDHALFILEK